eukprot:NODE_34_length_31639_cov_0.254375.p16 type:complete len:176 gc:universal NODE_34_length_31639_cov_0.254375:2559-3086(+)
MFWLAVVFLPVALIFTLLIYASLIYFKKKTLPFEFDEVPIPLNRQLIHSTAVQSKETRKQEQKEMYREFKKKQETYHQRQEYIRSEKAKQDSKITKFDKTWFKNTSITQKFIDIELELKCDSSVLLEYLKSKELVHIGELEVLFFYHKQELVAQIDHWISVGTLALRREGDLILL